MEEIVEFIVSAALLAVILTAAIFCASFVIITTANMLVQYVV